MTPLVLLGYLVAIGGAVFGLIGAYYTTSNDIKQRHFGFTCWTLNSPMLVASMIGVAFGWFEPVSTVFLAVLNAIYWFTAMRGWWNTR